MLKLLYSSQYPSHSLSINLNRITVLLRCVYAELRLYHTAPDAAAWGMKRAAALSTRQDQRAGSLRKKRNSGGVREHNAPADVCLEWLVSVDGLQPGSVVE